MECNAHMRKHCDCLDNNYLIIMYPKPLLASLVIPLIVQAMIFVSPDLAQQHTHQYMEDIVFVYPDHQTLQLVQ